MDAINRTIRKIRGKRKLAKPRDSSMDWLVEIRAVEHINSFKETSQRLERDRNFEKMIIGQKRYQEEKQAEKDRQEEISKARLKNLKKARRVRKKLAA